MDDDTRIKGQQPITVGEQRVDIDLLDPRLLDNQPAEAHQQLLERSVSGLDAPAPLQGGENPGLFHHPPRQRSVQRRQSQRAVPVNVGQLSSGSELQDRAQLRIGTRTDRSAQCRQWYHRLNDHALEVTGACALSATFFRIVRKAWRTAAALHRIEVHAPNVAFMDNALRSNFNYHGKAYLRRLPNRLLLRWPQCGSPR